MLSEKKKSNDNNNNNNKNEHFNCSLFPSINSNINIGHSYIKYRSSYSSPSLDSKSHSIDNRWDIRDNIGFLVIF